MLSVIPIILAANIPAFFAPDLPIAVVATGIPPGICTIDNKESNPFKLFDSVIGVPIESKSLKGLDSLLSIVQMPGGIPVATTAIGNAGAKNAGILAARILSISNESVRKHLDEYEQSLVDKVGEMQNELQ